MCRLSRSAAGLQWYTSIVAVRLEADPQPPCKLEHVTRPYPSLEPRPAARRASRPELRHHGRQSSHSSQATVTLAG
eukprot:246163-Rhodomonas_salina.2